MSNLAKSVFDVYVLVAVAFNALSLQSLWVDGVAFTATDPVLGTLQMVVVWIVFRLTEKLSPSRVHVIFCTCVALKLGVVANKHYALRESYASNDGFHDTNWWYAVGLHVVGMVALVYQAVTRGKRMCLACVLGVVVLSSVQSIRSVASPQCNDKQTFFSAPAAAFEVPEIGSPLARQREQRFSRYLAMSDGVELAVDVYLPFNYNATSEVGGLPTFLHLTRYHRADLRSWITRYLTIFGYPPTPHFHFPTRGLRYLNELVPAGYAYVVVDVRGTGASFGSRPIDLSNREVADFLELSQWVKQQPWCNGRIGTGGISYDGITGALMAALGNIQAAVLMFTPGDIYRDIAFVGGIPVSGFLEMYQRFCKASEQGGDVEDPDSLIPQVFKFVMKYFFDGVMPVTGAEDRLAHAIQQHAHNFDMAAAGRDPKIVGRDSVLKHYDGQDYTALNLGVNQQTFAGLLKHNVSVYSFGGFYDSGSIRSAARLHNFLQHNNGDSKLTIGPWNHGARACWTPSSTGTMTMYPMHYDVKRFLDCKLRDLCDNMPATEPKVHFFVSGAADKWSSSQDVWPPTTEIVSHRLTLSTMQACSLGIVVNSSNNVEFDVDFTATSGVVSRWNLVLHILKQPVTYPNRLEQVNKSVSFSSPRLNSALSIVGSVSLTVTITLTRGGKDAAVFVYLEDVDPTTGSVHYITEGCIRASHRVDAVHTDHVDAFDNVQRSYITTQRRALTYKQATAVDIILEPVAYVVPQHHVLRISFSGADNDNFYLKNIGELAKSWSIDATASTINLPLSTTISA